MDSEDEYMRPPGTYYDVIAHPTDARRAMEVAVVQDHRFAFFYWLKWWNKQECPHNLSTLVSLDWHQDLAPPDDDECQGLRNLDINNYKEISFFCWDKLHPHNDGHILSAAYLNIIGDIHVVQKQDESSVDHFEDAVGRKHTIHCYRSIAELIENISTEEHQSVFFDIDLDYFTESPDSDGGGKDVELVSATDIHECLSPEGKLMSWIFPRICGMTIATEPEFCGGLMNSNMLFNEVNNALFNPQLLSHRANWKR